MTEDEFRKLGLDHLPIINGGRPPEYSLIFKEVINGDCVSYYRIKHHGLRWAIGKISWSKGRGMCIAFDSLAEARNNVRN